jgi:mono/diheme cytochrome c family protein
VIDRYVSPEELRRLLSTLLAVVGAIMIFSLFAFIVVPGLRNANKPLPAPPVSPPQGETGWLDPTEYPPAKGYKLPPVDPESVLTLSPDLLSRGEALFRQNCQACHGTTGQGDGPASAGLRPSPRNFTRAEGWKSGYQLTGIYKTLSEGIAGSAMAAYDFITAKDRMALAHYVQSLGAFPHGPEDNEAVDALKKQFASAGEVVPNRIPVSMAMERLEREFTSPAPLIVPTGERVGHAGTLLARVIIDRTRAAQTLALAPSWAESAASLARAVAPGIPGNGFSVSVATLSPAEWQTLREELMQAMTRRETAAGPR